MKKRLLSLLLCGAMLFSFCPQAVSAEGVQDSGKTIGGMCEHHPEHTENCGYTEGTPGTPCGHEHTEDCYTLVTKCVHEHTADCYPVESVSANAATSSGADMAEPTECSHECSKESGCIKEKLDCKHDEDCGYTPATDGTPCTYVCESCNPQSSGQPEDKPLPDEDKCICTGFCTAENITGNCPVCGADDVDLSVCKGQTEPEEPDCTCEVPCAEGAVNTECPVCSAKGADLSQCKSSQEADNAVKNVREQINALPTADELAAMSLEDLQAVYADLQAAYDAYEALTDEQKAEVTGAEIFDSLFAVFSGMTNTLTEGPVSYISYSWDENEQELVRDDTETEQNYTLIDSNNAATTWKAGWYVVEGTVNLLSRVTVTGNVHLILKDGCHLNAGSGGIQVERGNSLTIYAQSEEESTMGRLTATATDNNCAGIGGGSKSGGSAGGDITIHGGKINAKGARFGAGIGSGSAMNTDGSTTIYGGIVTAEGDSDGYGAGIGDGCQADGGGTIIISGGTVYATGGTSCGAVIGSKKGTVTISGGIVSATCTNPNVRGIGGQNSTLTISGGTVTATGKKGIDCGNFSTTAQGNAVIITESFIPQVDESSLNGVIIVDWRGQVYGTNVTPTDDFTIPRNKDLTIPEGSTLTIRDDVTAINEGTIYKYGAINGTVTNQNDGIILEKSSATVFISDFDGPITEVAYGDNFFVNANVQKAAGNRAAGGSEGTVQFYVDMGGQKTSLGSSRVTDGTAQVHVNMNSNKWKDNWWKPGDYTITAEFLGSDTLMKSTGNGTLKVTTKTITESMVTWPSAMEVTYTGSAQPPAVTVQGLKLDTDYTVSYSRDGQSTTNFTDAGAIKVTITGSGYCTGTVEKLYTITLGILTAAGDGTANGTYGTKLRDLEITGLTVTFNGTTVNGTWEFTAPDQILDVKEDGYILNAAFTPESNPGNYETLTARIAVAIHKASAPQVTWPTSANELTYGQKLSDSVLTGGSTEYGFFEWKSPDTVPTMQNSGYAVVFIPSEATKQNYETISSTEQLVAVTVAKATPALILTPSAESLSGGGSITLTVAGLPDGGTAEVTCSDSGIELQADGSNVWTVTLPNSSQTYTFTAAYAGDDNHNAANASCQVAVSKKSSGGSSGGSGDSSYAEESIIASAGTDGTQVSSPLTGDSSPILLLLMALLVSAASIMASAAILRKRRKDG